MKKKQKVMGLIRKKPLTTSSEEYRVLGVNIETQEIFLVGQFHSLEEAKASANALKTKTLDTYVHGKYNRILYRVE